MGLRLMAEVGLDGSGFESGLKKLEHAGHGAFEGLKGFVVAGIGIGTVEQAISKTVESAEELINTSKRLAIAPEQLQVLRQAAKQSGSDIEALTGAFEKLDIAREKALMPGKEGRDARRAFASVGVDSSMLHSMTSAQLAMGPLGEAAKNRNPEEIGIAFREIFGKGFGPVLATLKTDFKELHDKMESVGALMDTETAVKLRMLGEQFTLLGQIIVSQLGPVLVQFGQWISENFLKLGKNVAGTAGFFAGGSNEMSGFNKAKFGVGVAFGAPEIASFFGRHGLFGFEDLGTSGYRKRMEERLGFKRDVGLEAAKDAEQPWVQAQAKLAEMQAKMAEQANQLNNPKPADFHAGTLPHFLAKSALETHGDSLTRVGNFLGGMGVTSQIEARKLELLQQIARNTGLLMKLASPFIPFAGGIVGAAGARMDLQIPHN